MAQDPRALLLKADKALQSASSGFSFFGGREEKYQNALDLYVHAANAFKMANMNRESGQTFEKAAQISIRNLNEPDDAANMMVDAFKAYRTESPQDATRCLESAIDRYCAKGNFRRAATHKEKLGEVYEQQLGDPAAAIAAYETAAQWYEGDNATSNANKLWSKVADLAALAENYYKAIENYEKVAQAYITNNLTRYSVNEYFLKAGICHMATKDMVSTHRALDKYREMDPAFASDRKHQLLVDLVQAVEAGDQEMFTEKLFQYDQGSKLDNWKTVMLLRIKNGIEDADNEFS